MLCVLCLCVCFFVVISLKARQTVIREEYLYSSNDCVFIARKSSKAQGFTRKLVFR